MRIELVRITNFKGIEYLELKPGAVTVIRGENGCGKTSILDAIRTCFDGGHNPQFIRNGSKNAEIEMQISDKQDIITVVKKITPKSYSLVIKRNDEEPIPAPATFMGKLADGIGFDPFRFIGLPSNKQTEYLLEVCLITVEAKEIAEAVLQKGKLALSWPDGVPCDYTKGGGIEVLDLALDTMQAGRKAVSKASLQLDGHIATIRKASGGEVDRSKDWAAESESLQEQLATAKATLNGIEQQAKSEVELQVSRIEADYQIALGKLNEDKSLKLAHLHKTASQLLRSESDELQVEIARISIEHSEAKSRAQRVDQADSADAGIKDAIQQSQAFEASLRFYEFAIENLRELRMKKLKVIGERVGDGEFREGQLFVGGVPFSELNMQRKMFTSIELALAGGKDLPLLICDGGESVVGERWEELIEALKGLQVQVILAVASNMPEIAVEVVA